jgi:hypothetical protein
MVKFFVGVDLGMSDDYTAIAVLEKLVVGSENTYHLRSLKRTRHVPYPEIVSKVKDIMQTPALQRDAVLVTDFTGVGTPVFQYFQKAGLRPAGVLIHGGDRTTKDGPVWKVPKRDLVGTMQIIMQNDRLKISWKLKLAKILSLEMLNFKMKFNAATAHDSYGAWREGDHDDLLLAVALAAWMGERHRPRKPFTVPPVASFNTNEIDRMAEAGYGEPHMGIEWDMAAQSRKEGEERRKQQNTIKNL